VGRFEKKKKKKRVQRVRKDPSVKIKRWENPRKAFVAGRSSRKKRESHKKKGASTTKKKGKKKTPIGREGDKDLEALY